MLVYAPMAMHDWIAPVDLERPFCPRLASISCLKEPGYGRPRSTQAISIVHGQYGHNFLIRMCKISKLSNLHKLSDQIWLQVKRVAPNYHWDCNETEDESTSLE